jgi:hypothetical protein
MRARKAAATTGDDEPEPVIITEVTDEFGDQSHLNVSSDIEQPDEEVKVEAFVVDDTVSEGYRFENGDNYVRMNSTKMEEPTSVPRKMPRKKLRNQDSDKESKESLNAFEDSVLTDMVTLNEEEEQQPSVQEVMTKTYIKASLEEVNSVEPEQTNARYFKEYEKALEKSRSQSSFEIENNYYSNTNSLARLETPVPPARPSRIYTMARKKKREALSPSENKENYYDLDANANYHTFPSVKPDKPCRTFRKKRTYSNSTTNTEIKSINEMEDRTINDNIVNAKQLSVSFLPLSSNVVGEPIIEYNLRETSLMIHLNLPAEPPLPPKRKKERPPTSTHGRFNSLPNHRCYVKGSLTPSEIDNNSYFQVSQ